MTERLCVIGLGYVGLPVAMAFARRFSGTVGFDINAQRIADLRRGRDVTGEVPAQSLEAVDLTLTSDPEVLRQGTFHVVTVPTPIDGNKHPDLGPLRNACALLGPRLTEGAVVVFESTVYPGVTEDVCGPLLEGASGLVRGRDFAIGYSPERINPGDRQHRFERIVKVVAGEDEATADRIAGVYGAVVEAGIHRAPSIRVAEAAKVIENTQRDLNIALMNELSLIFDRLDIRTSDVLAAAGTKWNFLPFTPGLVGGHCIGVDPYYLTAKAEEVGYRPDVILAGRRVNDEMGRHVARRTVKLLARSGRDIRGARIAVRGLTFKEDVPDLRNSRVPDIVEELRDFGCEPLVHDPLADPAEAREAYGIDLVPEDRLGDSDAVVLAVAHRPYRDRGAAALAEALRPGGVFIDVKSMADPTLLRADITYWSL